jgi:hypothetical protein
MRTTHLLVGVVNSTLCRDCALLNTIHPAAFSWHDDYYRQLRTVFARCDNRTVGLLVSPLSFSLELRSNLYAC